MSQIFRFSQQFAVGMLLLLCSGHKADAQWPAYVDRVQSQNVLVDTNPSRVSWVQYYTWPVWSNQVLPPTYPAPYGIVQHWLTPNWVSDVVVIGGNGFIFFTPKFAGRYKILYGDGTSGNWTTIRSGQEGKAIPIQLPTTKWATIWYQAGSTPGQHPDTYIQQRW